MNFYINSGKSVLYNYPLCLPRFYVFRGHEIWWRLWISCKISTSLWNMWEMLKEFRDLRIGGGSNSCGCCTELQGKNKHAVGGLRAPGYGISSLIPQRNSRQCPELICLSSWLHVAAPSWGGHCSELVLCYSGLQMRPASMLGVCWKRPAGLSQTHPAASLSGLPNIESSFEAQGLFCFQLLKLCYRNVQLQVHSLKSNTNTIEKAWLWSRMRSFLGPPRSMGRSSFPQVYLFPYGLAICRHL